ncbi:Myosin-1 [Stylophora pistillata]|uniref:Myosin-1 n=1 Tax=Stylophora pistillata TaxID=50429 RepID=A0A2B4SHE5_STYPI|nr:Myosin-1 [Stylophora pistillata]
MMYSWVRCSRKKSGVCDKAKGTNTSKEESKNTGKSPKKPRRLVKRFGEMSEEDVLKLKHPEHLDYNLDILFVGINPGLMPAYKGHPYAGANNHFCRQEMRDGKGELIRKVELYKPLIVCFNGKVIYELFSGSKCTVGRQKDPIPGTNTAVAARDTLSKALYSHLFDYLVQVINGALKKYKDYLSIGILDIYGFESFKENSFDQFAINYMNEKLHQVCVGFTFTIEQEEYIREGITWKTVDYFNNKIVCELIESKRPSGIMSALDEVCCSVKSKKEGLERTLIQFQTNGVIGKIMACSPHYVRCIKPSERKAPLAWNQQKVINQIRYLGFKESITIRKTGFAIRRHFECILRRFGIIAPETKHGWSGDRAEACRFILKAAGFDSGKWIIGKTKVFLKEPDALHDLENIKNEHINKACVMIQRNYRRHSIEKQYDEKKQASKFRRNSFTPRIDWKPQNRDLLAEMFQSTSEFKIERKSQPGSFTMLMKTIFGPLGGGVHCKGIWLEILEQSLTTATKEVCLHICNYKEEFAPLKTGEHLISEVVALGPNKDPLRAPAKLCLPLYDMCADHELFLRWSPTQVGEEAQWKDVFPGTFKGKFAGPTVILQIVNTKQVKVTTNTFGLFCIISREPSKIDSHQNDEREVKSGSLLSQGISGIIKLLGQKFRSEKEECFGQDQEISERIALIR